MKKYLYFLPVLLVFLSSCGNGKDDPPPIIDPTEDPALEVSSDNIRFGERAGFYSVMVESNQKWTLTSSEDWCSANIKGADGDAELTFTVTENPDYNERTQIFTLSAGELSKTVTIVQNARTKPYMDLSTDHLEYNIEGGTVILTVKTNTDWAISSDDGWCTAEFLGDDALGECAITVEPYAGDRQRSTTVTIEGIRDGKTLSATVDVVQTVDEVKYVLFEDEGFKNFCVANYDQNDDGKISYFEAEQARSMIIVPGSYSISSLAGISHFVNLTELAVNGNQLVELDVSMLNNLRNLECNTNSIRNLIVGRSNNLEQIYCQVNQLETLDVSGCPNLVRLDCSVNYLSDLNVSDNPRLRMLYIADNNFTSIDLSGLPELVSFGMSWNSITEIDLSPTPKLEILTLSDNPISVLDLTGCPELRNMQCRELSITELDISNCPHISFMDARDNTLLSKLYVWDGFDIEKVSFMLPSSIDIIEK